MICWFGCRDSKIQGFPKPLIARSCEEASLRRVPSAPSLLLPARSHGTQYLQCALLEHSAPPSCFSPVSLQRLGDPELPLPKAAQGSAPAVLYVEHPSA